MTLRSPRFLALLASVALVATALSPRTGWLAQFQLASVLGGSSQVVGMFYDLGIKQEDLPLAWALPAAQPEKNEVSYARVLATCPDDAALQVAGVLRRTERSQVLHQLQEAAKQHPAPEWYAASLRHACLNGLRLGNRDVDVNLPAPHPNAFLQTKPVDVPALQRALSDARQGARLDPKNGFFPTMEAIALYSLQQDDEAQTALLHAASRTRFDDGIRTEMLGALRLRELARGLQLALTETAVVAATVLPHYALFRGLARVATAQAVEKEQAGDLAGGLILRRAVMVLGNRVSQQTNWYIGSLVGTAMVQIAINRPGGAPPVTSKSLGLLKDCEGNCTETEAVQQARTRKVAAERLRQWKAFATKNGATDLVALYEQTQARKAAQALNFERATERSVYGISRVMVQTLGHLAALNLLLSLSVVLLLGGIGKLLLRRWPVGKAAHPAIGWGLGLVFCPLLLPVALWKLRRAEGSWRRRLGMLSATWLLPYLAIALLVRAEAGAIAPWLAMVGLMQGMSGGTTDPALGGSVTLWMVLVGVTLALPLLWLVGQAMVSWRQRVPATYGVARGAAHSAVPLAAALCVVYALLLPFIAQQERQLKQELRESIGSETAYLARLAAQSQR